MLRKFVLICFVSLLSAGLISCSSNTKKEDGEAAQKVSASDDSGSGSSESSTTEQGVTFNPEGSDSGAISGLSTVNFAYDKAILTANARNELERNADWIKNHPDANIQIEGHCDERGSIEYNLSLGERRAQSVKRYLVSLGVDSRRLSVISYGKEKLLDNGDSEAAHARNRRANFLPIPR